MTPNERAFCMSASGVTNAVVTVKMNSLYTRTRPHIYHIYGLRSESNDVQDAGACLQVESKRHEMQMLLGVDCVDKDSQVGFSSVNRLVDETSIL